MSSNGKWTTGDIPDQRGRVAVVTGANTGLGYHTAAALAQTGAHVVLAVRDLEKGNLALARIVAACPDADVTLQELDLSSLASVRAAAAALRKTYLRIDLLINNAGVMWTPKQLTADGFEMQFGTNHLGHFALTGLLLDNMLPVRGSRVVTVSSLGHRLRAAIHFDDCNGNTVTTGSPHTGNPNWPTCCSLTNCSAGWPPEISRPPRPWPPIRAARTPSWPATCPGSSNPPSRCSARWCFRAPRWAPCPRCAPPPTPMSRAGSTTAPTA